MLRGEQSNLRAIERTDARFLYTLLNDPTVQQGWGTSGVPISQNRIEHDIEQWLEIERTSDRPTVLIIETLEREQIGCAILVRSERANQSQITLSIAIATSSQHQGFGRDALGTLVSALFDNWGIHRIALTCDPANQPAIDLYESIGFTREATKRRATYMDGEFHDQYLYSYLATDPRP